MLNKPSSEDSATFVNKEINRWIKNQVILDKAKLYIDENDKELQLKVKKYKELLIINKYQTELINNEFDTTILRSDIEEYYKNHPEDFILHKNIVKARFVKVNHETKRLKKIENLIITKDDLEMKELSDFCEMYAENSFLNDSVWMYFSDFDHKIIISEKERKKIFSKKNKLYSFTDDDFFEKTDILSVNINLEDRNINFIDKKYIDRFKKDILIVNTARGEVVDEDAIIDNITEGKVLGYGTDVIKEEHTPKATNLKITSDPRIIRTPHVGGTAISAQEKAYKRVIEKLN